MSGKEEKRACWGESNMSPSDGRQRCMRFRYRRQRVVDPFRDFWRRCSPEWPGFESTAHWSPWSRLTVLVGLTLAVLALVA